MQSFWQEAWFFTWQLFTFMILFYSVWVPGFLTAGLLTCRLRYQAWSALLVNPVLSLKGLLHALAGGIVGSVGRKTSVNAMGDLLNRGVCASLAFAFLIASRNMTIHFWAVFALSLGAEFATGQVLGALVMAGIVTVGLSWLKLGGGNAPSINMPHGDISVDLPRFPSWRALLFSFNGWWAVLKFIGQETGRFAPSLAMGILLGGIILAAGLRPWWPTFADVFGHATLSSDFINALAGAALAVIASLSPVGNLPVVAALFKTDGLGYPGIISFCLASAIHPRDMKIYLKAWGWRQGLVLVCLLYGAAVLGGLGSTWIYAVFGFRPDLPPLRLISKLLSALGF